MDALSFSSRFGNFFNVDLATQSKEDAEVNGTLNRVGYRSDGWRQPFLLWLHAVVSDVRLIAITTSNTD